MDIKLASTDTDLAACFPVMLTLRPHLDEETFMERVRRQQAAGYRIVCVKDGHDTVALAGFRLGENLAWGRFLYVDDLVTLPDQRSRGHGKALLDWLRAHARQEQCVALHLDSGMQRTDAHRFYEREGMTATSLHFAESLANTR